MNQQRAYHEATIDFGGEPLIAATRIVEAVPSDDYLLYENDDEWSLGLGVHADLTVYPEWTVLRPQVADGGREVFPNANLSTTIHNALASIAVEEWRAYGTANFELARYNHKLELQDRETPLLKMFIPKAEIRFSDKSILLRALDPKALEDLKNRLDSILAQLPPSTDKQAASPQLDLPEINTYNAERYMTMVEEAVAEIKKQQYRKVILSRKIPLDSKIDMVASYVAGRQANTPSRSFLLSMDGFKAAGFSPETVVEVDDKGEVYTTPLAGTRSTGDDIMQELRLREELVSDSKEIAEHAISVYVAFDEMMMVCETETVSVINFMVVSRRGTVQHLASRLKGKLLGHCNSWDAFNALFPAVTASGVPKRESIESIGRFESGPRGLYSGCVMICDQSGKFDSALVLRSFFQQDDQTWLQAGAGIMNMSTPTRELEETREKLRSCSNYLVAPDE